MNENSYLSLPDTEKLKEGDIIEDVQTGKREKVQRGNFYGELMGQFAKSVRQLPYVYDILRLI